MELKWARAGPTAKPPARSNRTFMELKSRLYETVLHAFASSNRTFMELKSLKAIVK